MKLQHMVIIFLAIIMPILLLFSVYFNSEVHTLKLQRNLDTALKNATYDAVIAFEENSMSDILSGNAEAKRENITAAINMYIKSLATSQNLSSYNEKDIKEYIPAVAFGLYDGFYMYTPTLDDAGNYEHTLKNYVYYSEQIPGTDIIIRYSLDNYVAVTGTIDGDYKTMAGYLAPNATSQPYKSTEELYENIIVEKEVLPPLGIGSISYEYYLIPCQYKYNNDKIKIYIKDTGGQQKKLSTISGTLQWVDNSENIMNTGSWYTYSDFEITATTTPGSSNDNSAAQYYTDAETFTNWWESKVEIIGGIPAALNISTSNDPEDPNSAFSNHKKEIIKNKIQTNLDTAIAAYSNRQSISAKKFKMPTILSDDWEKIYSNVSVITFLQGVEIGLTEYNNYCVLNSTNHTEYANSNSLYFIQGNHNVGTFHDIRGTVVDTHGYRSNEFIGTRIITQPIESYSGSPGGLVIDYINQWMYYYKHLDLACYECINNAYSPGNDIKTFLNLAPNDVKKSYYTALARERYVTPKSTDNFNAPSSIMIAYEFKNPLGVVVTGWTNDSLTLYVTPTTTGLTDVKTFIDAVETTSQYYTDYKEVTVKVEGEDDSGNIVTKEEPITVQIDRENPIIHSITKTPNTLTNGSVRLTVNASDDKSGIKEYSFDNGVTWQVENYEEYTTNQPTINIKVKDNVGNISSTTASITNIDNTAPTLSVTYSPPGITTSSVTATITANEEIQEVTGWTRSADKKHLTKIYSANATESVTVSDLAGNSSTIDVIVNNIDDGPPSLTVSYSVVSGSVVATITANEEIKELTGWTRSADKKSLSKAYTNNTTENVVVSDLVGRTSTANIDITGIPVFNANTVEIGAEADGYYNFAAFGDKYINVQLNININNAIATNVSRYRIEIIKEGTVIGSGEISGATGGVKFNIYQEVRSLSLAANCEEYDMRITAITSTGIQSSSTKKIYVTSDIIFWVPAAGIELTYKSNPSVLGNNKINLSFN